MGPDGPYKLGLNEVRIGLTLPWFAIVLARYRLGPSHYDHAVVTGEMFDPRGAREAGLLDRVVPFDDLPAAGRAAAEDLTTLDRRAHKATKLRARQKILEELRWAIETDFPTKT